MCKSAREGQPIPNLLFGAVHYLLLNGADHPLKEFYPSIVSNPKSYKQSFKYFKDFCLRYQSEIESIMQSRLVQTNEVRRCAYLYPVFCTIYEKVNKPLALIEIGTSAGLQLLWDKYAYSYEQNDIYGNIDAGLHLTAKTRGNNSLILHTTPHPVAVRIGIDLNTIDLNDDDEKLWLTSLIWPEHKERLLMFEEAATCIKEVPVKLINGDGIRLIAKLIDEIPEDCVVCIFHTHVANQLSVEQKNQLLQNVESIGKGRDVFHIYNNIQDKYLHLDYYMEGMFRQNIVAETDGHGSWFEWQL